MKKSFLVCLLLSSLLPVAALAQTAAPAAPAPAPRQRPAPPPPAPYNPVPSGPAARDWPTWGYDQERTGWNRGETTLTPKNVSKLRMKWSTQLSTPANEVVMSTLTAPIVVEGVATAQGPKDMVYILGADDTLFAIDANSGKVAWQKTFPNPIKSNKKATWLCPNTANDTPVADKARGAVYFITSDGKLRGLSLADGSEKLAPTQMVTPFARAWSLNLIGDIVYSPSGRACGETQDRSSDWALALQPPTLTIDPSAVTAVNIADPAHPLVTRFFTDGARPAAPWGRGGVTRGPGDTVILETSDGLYDPAAGNFSESILKLAPRALRLVDSFVPDTWKWNNQHDLSGSASPTIFAYDGKPMIAVAQKEGILRLLDANAMGGAPNSGQHSTPLYKSPQLGNDAAKGTDPSQGVWGAVSTYLTPDNKRFVYVPMWGPNSKDAPKFANTNGDTPDGSIMAFQISGDFAKPVVDAVWQSPNLVMADPPTIANGVVYALSTGGQAFQNTTKIDGPRMGWDPTTTGAHFRSTPVGPMTLYALDAQTGKVLYSSKKLMADWVHMSEPVVALGKVFLVSHDGHVMALGLK